jgi:hypothetical protein
MNRYIPLICLTLCVSDIIAQQKILFDNTKNETAGNADWVIDNDQPIPSPAQPGITSLTLENYWLGGISSWGVEMVKQGFWVETLPSSGRISYGDGTNTQDLTNYKVFVVCEPNNPFSALEKTAMMNFVYNGGGLFIVGDHAIADRDGDGWDALEVWNDFMTVNPIKSNPFGIIFDEGSNISANPTLNISALPTDPILHGIKGDVLGIAFFNGGMMTINTTDNTSVRASVYQTGYSNTGTTGVMVAYATYGSGRVVAVGDSSVPEDETPQSGTTYPGWTQPSVGSVADGDDGVLITNATIWLAQSTPVVDPEPTNNATNFTAINPTSSSIKLTWTDAAGGTLPAGYLVKWSTSLSITNPVDGVVEADGVGKKNITVGTQIFTVTGLAANTTYYFKIYPYTNSGTNINYLVSSTPSASSTTLDGTTIINLEDFENCSSLSWKTYDVTGDDYWTCGLGYDEMNGFNGTTDEDWLISPALNLNSYSGEVLTFKTATQYAGPALELVYSTDYDGTSNPSTQGTWSSLTFILATATTFTSSGNVSIASIQGTSVYIAFKYKAIGIASGEAALWRVDDILIEGVADITPPTILSLSPDDNLTTVTPTENLIVTFSENVKQGNTGNISIYNANSSVFETIPYTDSRIKISNNSVTINPVNDLIYNSSYYVRIDVGVIQDIVGNAFLGINDNTTWNFTTQVSNSTSVLSNDGILIYPNPANVLVRILLSGNIKFSSISIFDVKGELKKGINNFVSKELTIDVSSFAKGIYFIKFVSDGKTYMHKLMIK